MTVNEQAPNEQAPNEQAANEQATNEQTVPSNVSDLDIRRCRCRRMLLLFVLRWIVMISHCYSLFPSPSTN